jgi:fructose-1,6-bisphosphatase/sedoheptulose 1,7-bisphosphatase-like protein
MGIKDVNAKLTLAELARGDVLFAGTGVTEATS